MKTTPHKKIPPRSTPQVHHLDAVKPLPVPLDGELDSDALFLNHVAKCSKLTVKDFQYGMRVNKTTAHAWFNGTKANPLKRARDTVAMIREAGQLWVIPMVLEYIAGSNFEGRVLTAEQNQLLIQLGGLVKP